MNCYEFTIVATGLSIDDNEWQNAFFEAGCDDAVVGLQRGVFALHFDREASSFEEAVGSACADVERTGATVRRIEPDPLVSSSDIAERVGLSRQAVSNYVTGERGQGFPAPVACVTTARPLWSWSEVATWLCTKGRLSDETVGRARSLEKLNAGLVNSKTEVTEPVSRSEPNTYATSSRSTTSRAPLAQDFRSNQPKFRTKVTSRHDTSGIGFLRPARRELVH